MNAADVMVTKVISVRSDASVEEIAEALLANRISAVPVLDKAGSLVGIVSEGDLIHRVESDTERRRSWWLELLTGRETLAREFIRSHARKAADVMTRNVITVKPETPLGELAFLLDKHRIKRVPVMKNGKMAGIVSRANLIQALVRRGNAATPNDAVDDFELRDKVLAQLQTQPWWTNDINIIVHDGAVEIWGIVDSDAERDAIRVAVEVTPGVRSVLNRLALSSLPAVS